MKAMYIMCGLPGSGKSTWAKKRVQEEEYGSTIIVSKDSIRTMINGEYVFDPEKEVVVGEIVKSIISGLKIPVNIIFDETNITEEKRRSLVYLAHQYGYTPLIVYCKGNGNNLDNRMKEPRGYTREKWGEVIDKMKKDFEEPVGNECEFMVVS